MITLFNIPVMLTGFVLGWVFCIIDLIICRLSNTEYTWKDTIQNHRDADYLLVKAGLVLPVNICAWVTLVLIIFL